MDNWVSFIIGNGLVNEFEKRKTNTDIEYSFGIQFTSHPSFFFREEKHTHRFRSSFKILMRLSFDSYSNL